MRNKLIRTAAIPDSLLLLLKGQLSFLNNYYKVIGVSSNASNFNEISKQENVETKSITIKRRISLWQDFISLYKLYLYLKKERPLIIHSITPKAGLLSMLAGKLASVPIRMHTFTGLIFPTRTGGMQKILIKMDKLLCWSATNVYPEGQGVKNDLIKYSITKKPLKVLANGNVNGIDATYFDPTLYSAEKKKQLKLELGIKQDDFVFVFVGRLVGDKGINELVSAFGKFPNQYAKAKLLLVGQQEPELDPLEEKTISLIKGHENIISVGYQSDVRPYFAISNALVFPSYREGFPNVVMQAGAMGLPSIVTDVNGSNEIIAEGENGTIIPSKDEEALREKMELFITDSDYVSKLKDKAREMIVSRYQREVVWAALLAEYKRLEVEYVQKKS